VSSDVQALIFEGGLAVGFLIFCFFTRRGKG
jgi:hypothetical protein